MDKEHTLQSNENTVDKPSKYNKYADDHVFNKLVRDNVPEMVEQYGLSCITTVIDDGPTLLRLLAEKVIEEANEVFDAVDVYSDLAEEIGDLLEVVDAIGYHFPYIIRDAKKAMKSKRKTHGGFCDRIFLIRTERAQTKEI